jgi:hypothetical protein
MFPAMIEAFSRFLAIFLWTRRATDMRATDFLKASAAVFLTYSLMEILIEYAVLREMYAVLEGVSGVHVYRKHLALLFAALLFSPLYVFIFYLGYRRRGNREGIRFGFYTGILLSLVTGLNMYAILRIPIGLVWTWAAYGMVQFMLCGLVLARVFSFLRIDPACKGEAPVSETESER